MIDIKPLTRLDPEDFRRLVQGYRSLAKYEVSKAESDDQVILALKLVQLVEPYDKRFENLDEETLARYEDMVTSGYSFGAFDGDLCVGIALGEAHAWNKSLWVWELHVAESHRRRGIGRRLVEAIEQKARASSMRTLVCETQNTNVPAIRFYRRVGFALEGIDLSYYANDDFPDGEIAVFMKKAIG